MTDRWQQYFDRQGAFERSWLRTAATHWTFHEVLYGMTLRHCPVPARILDVGCGPGWSDLYFASAGYEVTGVDSEPRLIEQARSLSERLQVPSQFALADAFDLREYYDRFDLVYSCGVLEHFDREVTVKLLQEQAKCAPRVLIQIPTRFTAYTGEITDERIYTIRELRKIVEDAGLRVVCAFGYGDVTVTRTQIWMRRLLPRSIWRELQNLGFAYSIAVLGDRSGA
jgi:SAM-dependent methyltransferase